MPEKFLELIINATQKAHIPSWLSGIIFVAVLVLVVIYFLSDAVKRVKENILPLFYDHEKRAKAQRRRRFAKHIEYQISQMNLSDDWRDYKYSDLEAEVEVEDSPANSGWRSLLFRRRPGIRRIRSLSKALASYQTSSVLLEGDPGSGKSVSLRHVVQIMAGKAKKKRSTNSLIPIYVDLKYLNRLSTEPVNQNLIYGFVRSRLTNTNDREVEDFLNDEFDNGLIAGTWLFFFDGFDEIPEVLSSTASDTYVGLYATAISDFLGGMTQCHGIVASRHFNGPNYLDWKRFRVLALSASRRQRLIEKSGLPKNVETKLMSRLGSTGSIFNQFSSNPLFLGLLCEYLRENDELPENAHQVFEAYIEKRFERDKEKIEAKFVLNLADLRETTEIIAFTMTSVPTLGLSPTKEKLKEVIEQGSIKLEWSLDQYLDALEYITIAQNSSKLQSQNFAFSHRRIQEYFATCHVLKEAGQVDTLKLLTDAKWRETAVTMCQTQPVGALVPLLDEAYNFLSAKLDRQNDENFHWPQHSLHILGILQEGFLNRLNDLPVPLSDLITSFLSYAYSTGNLLDKKWTIDNVGVINQKALRRLLEDALDSGSQWLTETAYKQLAALDRIPDQLIEKIRSVLVRMALSNQLFQNRHSIRAYLTRIDTSKGLLASFWLLLLAPYIDFVITIFALCLILWTKVDHPSSALIR